MVIQYLNTDLDLIGPVDLTELAAAFNAKGVFPLYDSTVGNDGQWYARFETHEQYHEPEPNIAAILTVIESIGELQRHTWQSCKLREFNIGYDCGSEPWAFNHGLSSETLRRMAEAGVSLRITLYPPKPDDESA